MDRISARSRTGATRRRAIALSLATTAFIASCAIPISYYDVTSYRNLTDLKVETTVLVESFDTVEIEKNEARIQEVHMNLLKAYEYEKGKGEDNSDTVKQIKKILELFEEDLTDYRQNAQASLGLKYFREAAVTLGQAFDIAIATENSKNRDKH